MRVFQGIHSVDDVVKRVKEYQNHLLAIIGIAALLSASIYGYFYLKAGREQAAYRTLVTSMEYFDAPIKKTDDNKSDDLAFLNKKEFKSDEEKWTKVEKVFSDAYSDHARSGVAPIFLAFQAEASLKLKKVPEAIKALRLLISSVGSAEVKEYYQTKLALLLIDTKNEKSVEEGLGVLKKMALDEAGVAHDMALYRLGEYFWYTKKFVEARNYWNQLLLKYEKDEKNPSIWVPMAKKKLRLIDSDVE